AKIKKLRPQDVSLGDEVVAVPPRFTGKSPCRPLKYGIWSGNCTQRQIRYSSPLTGAAVTPSPLGSGAPLRGLVRGIGASLLLSFRSSLSKAAFPYSSR